MTSLHPRSPCLNPDKLWLLPNKAKYNFGCYWIKDYKMRTLPWIIWVVLNHRNPYKKEAIGQRNKEMWKEKQREIWRYYTGDFEDDGGNGKSTCSAALQAEKANIRFLPSDLPHENSFAISPVRLP